MNRKQLLIAFGLALVLGGLGWVVYQNKQAEYGGSQSATRSGQDGNKVFAQFPVNDIAQVTVRQKTNSVTLVKKDDVWTVKERGGYAANFSALREFMQKVWELRVTRALPKAGARQIEKLELVGPEKGPGTLVEFKDPSGKTLASLLLGAKSMREGGGEGPMGGGGGWPNGRYIMADGNAKSVALVTEPFASIEPKAEDWLGKDWFKVEKIKSAAVVLPDASGNWKIERESESGEWKLAGAKAGESLDSSKTSALGWLLNAPAFDDVLPGAAPAEAGLDKPASVATLTTFDGLSYTLKIGRKNTNDDSKVTLQVAVAGDFAKERVAGKDEKPEDKAKLDKEFKDKTDKLQEKLKTEKAFAPWIYQVSKFTVETLLKDRKEFLSTNAPAAPAAPAGMMAPPAGLDAPSMLKPLETPAVPAAKLIEIKAVEKPVLAQPPTPMEALKAAAKTAATNAVINAVTNAVPAAKPAAGK